MPKCGKGNMENALFSHVLPASTSVMNLGRGGTIAQLPATLWLASQPGCAEEKAEMDVFVASRDDAQALVWSCLEHVGLWWWMSQVEMEKNGLLA
jgi:hypothetical protein